MYCPMYKAKRTKPFPPNAALREFRLSLGLSQSKFARECKVHEVYVSQIETGAARMGLTTASKIGERWPRELVAAGLSLLNLIRSQVVK